MQLHVLLFAHVAERLGHEATVEVREGATGRELAEVLTKDTGLGNVPGYCRLAVNSHFADWDEPLSEGDEVAILPPVSGG